MSIVPLLPMLGWSESPVLTQLQVDWESLSANPDSPVHRFLDTGARLAAAKSAYLGRLDVDPTSIDAKRAGQEIWGHATQSLPQFKLRVDGNGDI